jgi:hypothetical protein
MMAGAGFEGALETLFSIELFGNIVQDEDKTVGVPGGIRQHEAADAVHPLPFVFTRARDRHDHIAEGLAREHALDRIITLGRGWLLR